MTVTVTLIRKDMKHLFGDETVKEQTIIDDAKVDVVKEKEPSEEQNQTVKRPAWLKQQKGQKKSHNKKGSNKKVASGKAVPLQAQAQGENHTSQQNNAPNTRKKSENKVTKESSKEKNSDVSDSEADSERSEEEESSHEKKDSTLDDDDIEWER